MLTRKNLGSNFTWIYYFTNIKNSIFQLSISVFDEQKILFSWINFEETENDLYDISLDLISSKVFLHTLITKKIDNVDTKNS